MPTSFLCDRISTLFCFPVQLGPDSSLSSFQKTAPSGRHVAYDTAVSILDGFLGEFHFGYRHNNDAWQVSYRNDNL